MMMRLGTTNNRVAYASFKRFSGETPSTPKRWSHISAGALRQSFNGEQRLSPPSSNFKFADEYTLMSRGFVSDQWQKPVAIWLFSCAGACLSLICMGGYTRLTNSGLSMVDWDFQGRRQPNSDEEWKHEFEKYKKFPEYKVLFPNMTVDEFKSIFFNEWFHRQLGRATGAIFAVPFCYFLTRKALNRKMVFFLTGLLGFGAFQGLVGWWMVRSGLTEPSTKVKTPRVSPYRLAFHLGCGATLFLGLTWAGIVALPCVTFSTAGKAALKKLKPSVTVLSALGATTFLSGAFVAGNDAGYCYNTWPKMNDSWIPPEARETLAQKKNVFEDPAVVQFNHRNLAYITLLAAAAVAVKAAMIPGMPQLIQASTKVVFVSYLSQTTLGILCLLKAVPVPIGVAHQALGVGTLTGLLVLKVLMRG